MKRIVLSTTSSGLETLNVPHKLDFIRFNVKVNNVDFIDGKNINEARLSNIMLQSPAAPSATSPASVDEILKQFYLLEQKGYTEVLIVAISSQVSQSVAHLQAAKTRYTGSMTIYIYDSKLASVPEGMLAFEADQLFHQGKSVEQIFARLDTLRANSLSLITVAQLDYLIANRKISAPAGFFANLFDIKPVIELDKTGRLVPIKKIRKIEKAVDYIAEQIFLLKTQHANAFIYVLNCGDDMLSDYAMKLLAQKYKLTNVPLLKTSTITLANHGPHTVGIGAFYGELPLLTKYLSDR